MTACGPESLFEALNRGDDAAVENAFLAFEPYLRLIVRRRMPVRLRARFDSADVVQSAWADLLDGFRQGRWQFATANHLRQFLVRATQNRFLNSLRHATATREQALDHTAADELNAAGPSPSEEAVAGELWDRILLLCPPAHRELVQLRRDGLSLDEIAARTGLHEGSVRRILYELARRVVAPRGPRHAPAAAAED
jgi:RNA polymerase sigma-70 factor (ECF subfamily)